MTDDSAYYLVWAPQRVPGVIHRPFTEWVGVRPCAEFQLKQRVTAGGRGRLVAWSHNLERKIQTGEHFGRRWREPMETC